MQRGGCQPADDQQNGCHPISLGYGKKAHRGCGDRWRKQHQPFEVQSVSQVSDHWLQNGRQLLEDQERTGLYL